VVSQDGFNLTENWRSIIVVPISISTRQSGRGPTTVCHQVTTPDRAKFDGRIGTLSPEHLQAVDQALKAAMNLI